MCVCSIKMAARAASSAQKIMTAPIWIRCIFRFGNFEFHWYGLMYLVGFCRWLVPRALPDPAKPNSGWSKTEVDDLLTWTKCWARLCGGRSWAICALRSLSYINNPSGDHSRSGNGECRFHGVGFWRCRAAFYALCPQPQTRFFCRFRLLLAGPACAPPGHFLGPNWQFHQWRALGARQQVCPGGLFALNAGPLPRHPSQLAKPCSRAFALLSSSGSIPQSR